MGKRSVTFTTVHTFFRGLELPHLERSLFSLSKQSVKPDEFVFYDNDTTFSENEIRNILKMYLPDTAVVVLDKHGDANNRNASYCQNRAIKMSSNDTFIFTKSDCIFREDFYEKVLAQKTDNPMEFIATWMVQMNYHTETGKPHEQVNHAKDLEITGWREDVKRLAVVTGQFNPHGGVDAPCFCTTKQAMESVRYYDEHLRGWTLWQPELQSNMRKKGVAIKVVEEVCVYHMLHPIPTEEGERDLPKAHQIFNSSPRRHDPFFQ